MALYKKPTMTLEDVIGFRATAFERSPVIQRPDSDQIEYRSYLSMLVSHYRTGKAAAFALEMSHPQFSHLKNGHVYIGPKLKRRIDELLQEHFGKHA